MASTINPKTALIYAMVIAAVADSELRDSELFTITEIVKMLPIFNGYDSNKLEIVTGDCVSMLDQPDGIDAVLGLIKEALPDKLRQTAYALACDVVAADGDVAVEELSWLKLLQKELHITELQAVAIQTGARARYQRG